MAIFSCQMFAAQNNAHVKVSIGAQSVVVLEIVLE
jgi:hypothetical protein